MARTAKQAAENIGQYVYKHSKILMDIEVVISTLMTEAQYLVDQLELEYKKKLVAGLSSSTAKNEIIADIRQGTGVMQAWVNKQNRIINELTKSMVAAPVNDYANENKAAVFDWVLGSVKTSHCGDCIRMSNLSDSDGPKTLDGWRKHGVGLPREGKTECSYGCRCMLSIAQPAKATADPKAEKAAAITAKPTKRKDK